MRFKIQCIGNRNSFNLLRWFSLKSNYFLMLNSVTHLYLETSQIINTMYSQSYFSFEKIAVLAYSNTSCLSYYFQCISLRIHLFMISVRKSPHKKCFTLQATRNFFFFLITENLLYLLKIRVKNYDRMFMCMWISHMAASYFAKIVNTNNSPKKKTRSQAHFSDLIFRLRFQSNNYMVVK